VAKVAGSRPGSAEQQQSARSFGDLPQAASGVQSDRNRPGRFPPPARGCRLAQRSAPHRFAHPRCKPDPVPRRPQTARMAVRTTAPAHGGTGAGPPRRSTGLAPRRSSFDQFALKLAGIEPARRVHRQAAPQKASGARPITNQAPCRSTTWRRHCDHQTASPQVCRPAAVGRAVTKGHQGC